MKNFKLTAVLFLLMLVIFIPTANAEIITIFHTNDLHARVKSTDDNGKTIGLAAMNALVKQEKSHADFVLWLDAGDTFHGMPYMNISRGEGMVKLLNASELDTFVPGNHEFNYGTKRVEEISKEVDFDFICANIVKKNTTERIFQPYKIYETPQGTKIGIFGLITPETRYKASPENVESIDFLDPVETAREMVEILRPQCNIVIGLMHMGIDRYSEYTSDIIAAEVRGIDLIVDGHSHTELDEGLEIGNTVIVQTGMHGYRFGRVEIEVQNHKIISETLELLDKNDIRSMIPRPDDNILQLLEKIEHETDQLFDTEIGRSDRRLENNSLIMCRRETELGDLCADAFRWKTGADIAVVNGGGIRSHIPAGKITYRDIAKIYPFDNRIQLVEINGKLVREMLNFSISQYPKIFNGFLQVSGIRFSYDARKDIGSQVGDIYIGEELLDESKIYTMAVSDFLLQGGDGYDMLKSCKVLKDFGTCDEAMRDFVEQVGVKKIEIGRIKLQDSDSEDDLAVA